MKPISKSSSATCVLLVILAAQISLSPFGSDFKISAGVVLLPVFAFVLGRFPVLPVSLISGVGVFISRLLYSLLQDGAASPLEHLPEVAFYLVYGLCSWGYYEKINFSFDRWQSLLPLAAIDYLSNLCEMIFRPQSAFSLNIQLWLIAAALGRTAIIWAVWSVLQYQSVSLLRREHAVRYKNLVLLISKLRCEVIWMDKNASMIESTMSDAYSLYRQLSEQGLPQSSQALKIATDIHEIKKEYKVITQGISQALQSDLGSEPMSLRQLWQLLRENTDRQAASQGRSIDWHVSIPFDFYVKKQYQFLSIFRNLLDNALEASSSQKIRLDFSLKAEGDNLAFTLANDGPEIKPENLSRIFSPGFSTKINYTTGQVKRGLGLSLVRDLAENELSGSVTAGCSGGLTFFTVTVPRAALEE